MAAACQRVARSCAPHVAAARRSMNRDWVEMGRAAGSSAPRAGGSGRAAVGRGLGSGAARVEVDAAMLFAFANVKR